MSLQTEWPGIAQSPGGACWGESWGVGAVPEGAKCFSLYLASGTDMAYAFAQSKMELQRLNHTLGRLLMRLFCLFIHFNLYMPYFSLGPSGHLCLIRLEGLQFGLPMPLGAQFLYMTLAIKQITVGLCASKLRIDVSILVNPVPTFLALIEFHHHRVLSTWNDQCADYSVIVTGGTL